MTRPVTDSRRNWRALQFGVLCGLLGAALVAAPWGSYLEETFGLGWLFQLRGPRTPPSEAVVIGIDKESSRELQVPYDTSRWPRGLHAQLIDRLSERGARVIVFDLLFRSPRDAAQDAALAAAIRQAGNVLLLEHLEKDVIKLGGAAQPNLDAIKQYLVPPIPPLAATAAATAPFTLPKVPATVSQYWTFDRNAGDVPTLPTLALQQYGLPVYDTLIDAIRQFDPRLVTDLPEHRIALEQTPRIDRTASALRDLLHEDPRLAGSLRRRAYAIDDLTDQQLYRGLIELYAQGPSRHLNLYGPPLTIPTIPYSRVIAAKEPAADRPPALPDLRDKAVFVGISSPVQWQQRDHFATAYSDAVSGHDVSGIEILATAFLNLLHRESITPLPPGSLLALVIVWGLFGGFLMRYLPPFTGGLLVLALSGCYLLAATRIFDEMLIWVPLVIPLMVQMPAAILGATAMHYLEANHDRARIREIFRYYLPEEVVDRLVREGGRPNADRNKVFGVCLHADAERYTTLCETMAPEKLATFMNRYYDTIFAPVRAEGGHISDVVGDAMLAIWASRKDDKAFRAAAIRAAFGMLQAMDEFAEDESFPKLRSRIGIHCGEMVLTHLGGQNHFEYRAVGDIVNTAARVQELNKQLNTRLLVSSETLLLLDEIKATPRGSYILKGKSHSIDIYEPAIPDSVRNGRWANLKQTD